MGAAAGSAYYTIALRNISKTACTLTGYPGVSLVASASGVQVGAAAVREPGAAERTEQLLAGGSTTFSVQIANAANYPQQVCGPISTRGLRIYPPGQKAALFLPRSGITGCSGKSVNLLTVGPVGYDPADR